MMHSAISAKVNLSGKVQLRRRSLRSLVKLKLADSNGENRVAHVFFQRTKNYQSRRDPSCKLLHLRAQDSTKELRTTNLFKQIVTFDFRIRIFLLIYLFHVIAMLNEQLEMEMKMGCLLHA